VGVEHQVWREVSGYSGAVALSGVDDESLPAEECGDGGELDGFWAGAHHDRDAQWRSSRYQKTWVRSPVQKRRAATNSRR
jgi:hypothetical protein